MADLTPFDRWIRSELENHEATRPGDAWERFVSRTDRPQDSAEDQAFDRDLRSKLESHQAGDQQNHWSRLQSRLEAEARRRSELVRIKIVESILLGLLLLTLWQLPESWPHSRAIGDQPAPAMAAVPEPSVQVDIFTSGPKTETDRLPGLSTHEGTSYSARPVNAGVNVRPTSIRTILHNGSTADNSRAAEVPPVMGSPALGTGPMIVPDDRPMDALPALVAGLLTPAAPDLHLPEVRTKVQHRHRVSMALRGNLNYIMTPYDQLLDNRGYDQLVQGYGGAIGYSREGPHWTWRLGFTYHRTYYLPKPYTEVFDGDFQRGYFSETLRDIELNMVSLSVQAQRSFLRRNRWHIYGIGGATGHLATQANYDRKQTYTPGTDPIPDGTVPSPLVESKTSQKRYADGFFEGGSLAENTYLTLDLGAGVERHLSERLSMFFEPVFQYNPLKESLGPNRDRINTLGLSLGTRITL